MFPFLLPYFMACIGIFGTGSTITRQVAQHETEAGG